MVLIKPPEDWSDEVSNRYSGPPPVPSIYSGTVDKAWRTQCGENSQNPGADMLVISLKIGDGKFKGATILTNLVVIKSNAWSINQFLDALTDGSEKQREAIKKWFWTIGYQVSDEVEKIGQPITHIGKKFELTDKPITFATKMGKWEGKDRAELDRFVLKLDDDDDDDDDDGFTPEPETSEPVEDSTPVAEESAGPPSEGDDDDDDPWS